MFQTLDDLDFTGRRVILRGDLNVPMSDGQVTDATRLNRLAKFLEFAEAEDNVPQNPNQILPRLSRTDVSVADAELAPNPYRRGPFLAPLGHGGGRSSTANKGGGTAGGAGGGAPQGQGRGQRR